MKAIHKNISGDVTNSVLVRSGVDFKISEISIVNTHGSNNCIVSLFINDGSTDFYIIKNLRLPIGTTLVLDNENVNVNCRLNSIKLTTTGSSSLTIIIK